MTISPSLATFADRLIEEKGLEGLDSEVLAQVKSDLISRLEDRVNANILAHMPESELGAFSTILESEDEQKIHAFCTKHVPNLDDVVAEALLGFRETYIGG